MDDILDFSSNSKILGKPVVSDLKEGKVTLPIVYAMEQCTPAEARLIETVLAGAGVQDSFTEGNSVSGGEVSDGGKSSNIWLSRFAAEAHSALQLFPESPVQRGTGSDSAVHSRSGKVESGEFCWMIWRR